jgi:N-acetylneuraminate synthase
VRGVYAKHDLAEGHRLTDNDVYLAVPLLKGQISCRELIAGEELSHAVKAHEAITINDLNNPYSRVAQLREHIEQRGI